ncbi:transcriptional regulator [Rhizobium sp. ACO-34A]|nr:LacI family DNA-binding transcriptional regulator [Rhizobium sp. ACO-34A]ATN36002.1 transcriptional regulator [Rhizobium sp. ACO-34A]
MKDVSRLAGVSKMTVSRTLADPSLVSADTRERVMRAIEQLGYVPDKVASALSSRRTKFVSLILPTLTNSNFAGTAQGLATALRAEDYQLLIGYTLYSLEEEERLVRTMLARRPDAVVLASTTHTKATTEMLLRAHVPVVEIWDIPDRPIDYAIGFSNFEVGRLAARYLISLGHRRIAAMGHRNDCEALDVRGENRLNGFAAALREAGLPDDLVVRNCIAPASYAHGAESIGVVLERAPDVEAVFAVADISAVGALMECHRRHIKVPEQISIIGFGDFDIGRQCVPSISTIRVDAEDIGRRTGEHLLRVIGSESGRSDSSSSHVEDAGFTLLPRETTMLKVRTDTGVTEQLAD